MPITIGQQLGSYEITALLGKGGMGEVYRARDAKLKREVAIKILPDEFARDPERVSRFQREAEVLASLNHSNIASIYDLQEADGSRFLVLELVEGDTLADRLEHGPIPIDDALRIAKHICEALEAAHEKGIVHRDLKPGNVKITPDGKVKVLDFGLAKALQSAPGVTTMSNSPTLTLAGTNAGVILGTAAYMSPEQARGRSADSRSDVFSFGCVFFEMLTGRQAFHGEDVSEVLASVLKSEPDMNLLPPKLHPKVQDVLRRCLQKNPNLRWHAIGDARVEIEAVLADPRGAVVEEPRVPFAKPTLWRRVLPVVAAIVLSAAITGVAVWNFKPSLPLQVTQFPLLLGENQQFTNLGATLLTISPDGTQVVYEANRQLYHRQMSELEARPIAGTQSAQVIGAPLFSPDGRSVAYWSLADQALKKIAVSGGASVTICPAGNFFGGTWEESGIVFALPAGIVRVPATGGKPETLVVMKNNEVAYGPQILPGGEAVLFTVAKGQGAEWDNAQVVVQSLKSGERKTLIERGTDGRYLPTGHIVYGFGGTLFAVPFDVRRLQVTGTQVPIVEGVRRTTFRFGGGMQFSFSKTGTLIYVPGPVSTTGEQQVLALMDRSGGIKPLGLPAGNYSFPRISHDGKRAAFTLEDGKEANVWIYDLSGTSPMRRLTFGGANRYPIWSWNDERVGFQSDREGDLGIFWQKSDFTGTAERLTKPEKDIGHIPDSWAPDGPRFSYTEVKGTNASVWIFSLQDKKGTLFASAPSGYLGRSVFSPDGRWVAYQSNEPSAAGVFVQPFPADGSTRHLVAKRTANTPHHPQWSRDGKELFYIPGPSRFAVVSVTSRPTFTFTNPSALPGTFIENVGAVRNYDVLPDGKEFIGTVNPELGLGSVVSGTRIIVVLSWFEDLKQRMGVK
jgi:eukaryotic-like serine/threonine-protein kinase